MSEINEMSEMEQLEAMVAEDSNEGGSKSYLTKEQKKNKEFKVKGKEEKIRFITFDPKTEKSDKKFYASALFHDMQIGEFKQKVYCNQNDSKPCPLCKKSKQIMDTQNKHHNNDQSIKDKNIIIYKRAKQLEAKPYKIFKIVDMGAMKDGVKFWRTSKPIEGTSVVEKFTTAVKAHHESYPENSYYNFNNGVTFVVNSVQKTLNTNKSIKYWEVSSIMPYGKPQPIGDDKEITNIVAEKVQWTDIFNKFEIKDVMTFDEFLELCAEGNAPYWDKVNSTFVFPNHNEILEKYKRVQLERRTNVSDDSANSDEDNSMNDLEAIENKYANTISPAVGTTIEDSEEEFEEEYDEDDDLPF